jgi:hypothetical protein
MFVDALVAGHFFRQLLNVSHRHSCCQSLPTFASLDDGLLLHPPQRRGSTTTTTS